MMLLLLLNTAIRVWPYCDSSQLAIVLTIIDRIVDRIKEIILELAEGCFVG